MPPSTSKYYSEENMSKKAFSVVMALILVLGLSANVFADTIRLKNGSVIKGQVVGFNDQQFIVLITSSRGRQSKMMIYMEDVESIEFDSAKNTPTNDDNSNNNNSTNTQPTNKSPSNVNTSYPPTTNDNSTTNNQSKNSGFIPIKTVKVLADNTNNGWTSSGYVVRRGQKIRITTSGRIGLGSGRYSSPGGISTLPDKDKLMQKESTGGLIAVIGDDNNDFIFLGARREFRADRDGILFLGVNEGNLNDNTGFFEAVIEIEDNP
jgi:small nuclear ribonucleoprotein (snRNP)-like protein